MSENRILNIREPDAEIQASAQDPVRVLRELVVEEGHEGQQGRIDLVLELGRWGVVVLEVKKGDADSAITAKQLGYKNSIENDLAFQVREKRTFSLLLAPAERSSTALMSGATQNFAAIYVDWPWTGCAPKPRDYLRLLLRS